jgi:hypothetical protein
MYLGMSADHSTTVGLILNLQTGSISPQYHVIYDEQFTTVHGSLTPELFDSDEWEDLIRCDPPVNLVAPDDIVDGHPPYEDLYDKFLVDNQPHDDSSQGSEGESDSESDDDSVQSESEDEPSQTTVKGEPPVRTTRSGKTYTTTNYLSMNHHKPPQVATTTSHSLTERMAYLAGGNDNAKVRQGVLESQYRQSLDWDPKKDLKTLFAKHVFADMMMSYDNMTGLLESWEPFAFAAKLNDDDNPSYNQALNGPSREGYELAMQKEWDVLTKMKAWTIVDRKPWMKVTPLTWALKCKRTAAGLISKLKARICVRGDLETEGVDYFATYAPTAKWTTIRLLIVMTAAYNMATCQIDYTSAFLHADVEKPPNWNSMSKSEKDKWGVYVEMPRGFTIPGKVLKLRKNLYGRSSAPRQWFKLLKSKLEEAGFEQQIDIDPCLFISDTVIIVVFVDDTLLFSNTQQEIDKALIRLRGMNLTLEVEDDVAGFLGVTINRDVPGEITLSQEGITNRIIADMHIENYPDADTPASTVLGTDENGDPIDGTFNYSSIVGAMWYLCCHSRADIQFALSQCSRFSFNPKRSHELALIQIGRYLRATSTKGITFKPSDISTLHLDVYVDSDFLGLYGHEDRTDPTNVKSRCGYTMLLNNCPLIWSSHLMDGICLSTMMAEYYALSIAMREVIPLRELIKGVVPHCGFDKDLVTTFWTVVHEDNTGALTLANLEPGQSTPRSKFYDSKVHWFRSHLHPESENHEFGPIIVQKVDTKLQLADIFTKPLPKADFERIRLLLMGW